MQLAANRPVAGIVWMIVTGLLFVGVTAVVKHVGDDLPASQSAFLRYLLGLVFLIPMLKPILAARLTRRQVWLFGWRGLAHTFAVMLWFYAMTQITIAEVTAMNYLNPVYVTIGAALFLVETLALRRIAAIVAAPFRRRRPAGPSRSKDFQHRFRRTALVAGRSALGRRE